MRTRLVRAVKRMPRRLIGGHGGSEEQHPRPVRQPRDQLRERDRAVDRADQRDQQVVEKHRPSGQKPEARVKAQPDVGIGGTGRRIERRHLSVADGGQPHCYHSEQDCRDGVPVGKLLGKSEEGDGSDRHHQHDAVEDQVPERQNPTEPGRRRAFGGGRGGAGFGRAHEIPRFDYAGAMPAPVNTFISKSAGMSGIKRTN